MTELIEINTSVIYDTNNVKIIGSYDNPWFIAKDICKKIGLVNIVMALKKIPPNWRSMAKIGTISGEQDCNIINEPGLYMLIMRSDKPEAQKFREWICEDVLPSLRKKGVYELEQKLQKQKEDTEQKITTLENATIKLKKKLKVSQSKFSERHKFPIGESVYILENPKDEIQRYKIGRTNNINVRLAADRTMIPDIKIKFLMYVSDSKMFENVVKNVCEDSFEDTAHEWVLDSLPNLIKIYKDIDSEIGSQGRIQKELWKYNLEDKKSEEIVREEKELKCVESKFEENLVSFLPTRLLRYEYLQKNKESPDGMKWCNGFCQNHRPLTQFSKVSYAYSTICMLCENKVDVANSRILSGEITSKQIREDPDIIDLKVNQRICRKCQKVLDICNFEPKKRQCRTCRNKSRSQFGKKFENIIEEQISIIQKLSDHDRKIKLNRYTKIELHKIGQYLGIGRKFNDKKANVVENILKYYESVFET